MGGTAVKSCPGPKRRGRAAPSARVCGKWTPPSRNPEDFISNAREAIRLAIVDMQRLLSIALDPLPSGNRNQASVGESCPSRSDTADDSPLVHAGGASADKGVASVDESAAHLLSVWRDDPPRPRLELSPIAPSPATPPESTSPLSTPPPFPLPEDAHSDSTSPQEPVRFDTPAMEADRSALEDALGALDSSSHNYEHHQLSPFPDPWSSSCYGSEPGATVPETSGSFTLLASPPAPRLTFETNKVEALATPHAHSLRSAAPLLAPRSALKRSSSSDTISPKKPRVKVHFQESGGALRTTPNPPHSNPDRIDTKSVDPPVSDAPCDQLVAGASNLASVNRVSANSVEQAPCVLFDDLKWPASHDGTPHPDRGSVRAPLVSPPTPVSILDLSAFGVKPCASIPKHHLTYFHRQSYPRRNTRGIHGSLGIGNNASFCTLGRTRDEAALVNVMPFVKERMQDHCDTMVACLKPELQPDLPQNPGDPALVLCLYPESMVFEHSGRSRLFELFVSTTHGWRYFGQYEVRAWQKIIPAALICNLPLNIQIQWRETSIKGKPAQRAKRLLQMRPTDEVDQFEAGKAPLFSSDGEPFPILQACRFARSFYVLECVGFNLSLYEALVDWVDGHNEAGNNEHVIPGSKARSKKGKL